MTQHVKVYGERNTNTNYLSRLIQLNLDARELPGVVPPHILTLQRRFPGNEWVRDFYFRLTYRRNLGWKHTRAKPPSELRKYAIIRNDVHFVTITKNPYSWLLSLHRRPYHQNHRTKTTFEEFLVTPWKTVGRENCDALLRSPIELWNLKNSSYLQLAELECLSITTESMFEDPGAVMNKISNQFAIHRLSREFLNCEESTKERGKNTVYYRDYYLNERWRDTLSRNAISIISAGIDKGLMDHFGYEVLL